MKQSQVIILDPGLREYAGHHPAIIEGLLNSDAIQKSNLNITVYGSLDCSLDLLDIFSNGIIKIIPYFKSDFYYHFYSHEKLSKFNKYIIRLAKEYVKLFLLYKNDSVAFLYHTLNWDHAYALSLALNVYKDNNGVKHQHLICLMFNPRTFLYESSVNNDRYFKFNLAFKMLSKFSNVKLFSAEYELTQHYQNIFGYIPENHPCGLISQSHIKEIIENKNKNKNKNILLYLGDAKVNKGFLQLPEMVNILANSMLNEDVKFIIHYTITNENIDLEAINQALKVLSKKDLRINLYSHFLTDNELHQLWLSTTHVVFNYDQVIYGNQSSGVLWQAAAYQTKIYLMTNSWLNRESKRLGCDYFYTETLSELKIKLKNDIQAVSETKGQDTPNEYRDNLLSDFSLWLVTQIKTQKERKREIFNR